MNKSYDVFSTFYDEVMGDCATKATALRKIIENYAPAARSVLDVACGTGALLKYLEADYAISGIDISPKMISIAEKKINSPHISLADMRNFNLKKRFDVALCLFDSLNHLLSPSEWEQTFRSVHSHLNEGGVFIFDINTPLMLQEKAREKTWVRHFGNNYLLMKVYEEGMVYAWDVKIFEHAHDSYYVLHNEKILEASFPQHEVESLLSELFFIKAIVNIDGTSWNNEAIRPFYVCSRR